MGKTIVQLTAIIRQKANVEGNSFVSDSDIAGYINEAQKELHDLIVGVDGSYYESTDDFTLTASPAGAVHALPATFYKMRGLELFPDTTRAQPVFARNFSERHRSPLGYVLDGNNITVWPWQLAGQGPWRLYYTPKCVLLPYPGASEQLDVTVDNFDEFITLKPAITITLKRQKDPSGLMAELNGVTARVNAMVPQRQSEPEQAPILWGPGRRRRSWYDDDEVI